jgi:hypothetical protein
MEHENLTRSNALKCHADYKRTLLNIGVFRVHGQIREQHSYSYVRNADQVAFCGSAVARHMAHEVPQQAACGDLVWSMGGMWCGSAVARHMAHGRHVVA